MTVIACRQLAPVIGDLAGNLQRAADALTAAVTAGADIVVLPELVTSGYLFTDPDEARANALRSDDPIFDQWAAALTGDAVAVAGFAELADDALYNSAAVLDGSGIRVVYRKAHLWDRETLFFRPGATPPPVTETAHGRIGAIICYDLEFPEYVRSLALAGADLIAVPTNWPHVPRPTGERPPEVIIGQAAARVNRVAIACCDREGDERGEHWTRGTSIIDADGWVVAGVGGDVHAELNLGASRNKAISERNHVFADRRTDLYLH